MKSHAPEDPWSPLGLSRWIGFNADVAGIPSVAVNVAVGLGVADRGLGIEAVPLLVRHAPERGR